MIVRLLAVLVLVIASASCAGESEKASQWEMPPDLAELRANVGNCRRDTDLVPAERSEHCVVAAESYFGIARGDCEGAESLDCLNYNAVVADIRIQYNFAVMNSLIKFGVPDWMDEAQRGEVFPSLTYMNGDLMRKLFRECLDAEREGLAANGLEPVTEIVTPLLEDGQLCVRMGYPDFKTRPLSIS